MKMYNRYADDLSEELFDSVYRDLYDIAEKQNKALYETSKRKNKKTNVYYPGDAQDVLNGFCKGEISLGEALDFISIEKAYNAPLLTE